MALKNIDKKLQSKKIYLKGQNLTRHQAVLAFLRTEESKKLGDTREEMSYMVARCFGKGIYFARKLVSWEITWKKTRDIEEEKKGCFAKTRSWLNDEGVQLVVRKWLSEAGEGKLYLTL